MLPPDPLEVPPRNCSVQNAALRDMGSDYTHTKKIKRYIRKKHSNGYGNKKLPNLCRTLGVIDANLEVCREAAAFRGNVARSEAKGEIFCSQEEVRGQSPSLCFRPM